MNSSSRAGSRRAPRTVATGVFYLVLRLAGFERFGQVAPEPVEPRVGHLEEAAEIGRTLLVEECRRPGGGAVATAGAVAVAVQESQGDKSVEEVIDRAR